MAVVVPVWVWECDCFNLFQNLGMGMCFFRFRCGDVVVLICSDGLLLFCLVDREFGWWMWLFCLDGGWWMWLFYLVEPGVWSLWWR